MGAVDTVILAGHACSGAVTNGGPCSEKLQEDVQDMVQVDGTGTNAGYCLDGYGNQYKLLFRKIQGPPSIAGQFQDGSRYQDREMFRKIQGPVSATIVKDTGSQRLTGCNCHILKRIIAQFKADMFKKG